MSDKVDDNRRIKAVIFDLDGVLVDTEIRYVERMKEFYTLYGIELPKDVLHAIVGGSLDVNWGILKPYNPESSFLRKLTGSFPPPKNLITWSVLTKGR